MKRRGVDQKGAWVKETAGTISFGGGGGGGSSGLPLAQLSGWASDTGRKGLSFLGQSRVLIERLKHKRLWAGEK